MIGTKRSTPTTLPILTLLVAGVLCLVVGSTPAADAVPLTRTSTSTSTKADTTSPAPSFGLLGPTTTQIAALRGSSVKRLTLSAGWDNIEPHQNIFNTVLLSQLHSRLEALRADGFSVVLDLGLQYPPSWVFSLPGQTRFVDQYGDAWHGSLSEDIPNAVFDTAVRTAQRGYIARVATALGPTNLASVRVGGLLSGELRYPPATYNGHSNLLWDYGSTAQASAPVAGWRPGTGTHAQISSSLSYYFNSLTGYERWLIGVTNDYFPGVNEQVLFPSWGLRPGMVTAAVDSGMTGHTNAEVNGMISSGLAWASQVQAIAELGVNATVYTTWLDAPTQANTVQGIAPVVYLASLAAEYGLPMAGENTGGGGPVPLAHCLLRARAYHLTGMMYMSGGDIASGTAGISLTALKAAATSLGH